MKEKISYAQFKQAKVAWSGYDVIDIKKPKVKITVKIWDDTMVKSYWLKRDRVIYSTTTDEQTRLDILERYGKAKT